jgi:hypothetical protein
MINKAKKSRSKNQRIMKARQEMSKITSWTFLISNVKP